MAPRCLRILICSPPTLAFVVRVPIGSFRRLSSRPRCKSYTTRSSTQPPRPRPISATSTRSCSRTSRAKAPRLSPPRWPSRSGVSRSRSATSSASRLSTLQRRVPAVSILSSAPRQILVWLTSRAAHRSVARIGLQGGLGRRLDPVARVLPVGRAGLDGLERGRCL